MSGPSIQIRTHGAIADLPRGAWNALVTQAFLRHEFLDALEASGCVSPRTGWQPCHVSVWRDGALVAAAPLYAKAHSFGEYVFDWAWAEAYDRAGMAYYPKLVCCVPFTPVAGARLLAADAHAAHALRGALLELADEPQHSSLHVLFPTGEESAALQHDGWLLRHGVQFHWHNTGYAGFSDFLARLERDKRKKIRQERRRVADAGIMLRVRVGEEIDERDWDFFYRCYQRTYRLHRSTAYLNREFFRRLAHAMAPHLVLVIAERAGRPLAAAFNVMEGGVLYGRYWGALEDVPLLHFETCYYRAIEFCIERRLSRFEGGAQGEHKLARGFLPTLTYSAHRIRDGRFRAAIARHVERERSGTGFYVDELNERAPFRRRA